MPLKLKRYPEKSPNWYVRGTEAGISIFESTGTVERKEAEAYRKKRRIELYATGALGVEQPTTFADAMSAYVMHGGENRFLEPLLDYFKEKPLAEIGQTEIDQCAHALYPGCKAATLNRQVYGPMIAIMRQAAKSGAPGASLPILSMLKVEKVPPVWTTDDYIRRLADDGFDIGWSFAAPVGHGGFPDEWIVGWMPLPPPRKGTEAVTIKEIPRSFEYCCDKCKASHLQQNASGHYTNSTPPQWFRLRLHSDYYRYPVANEEPTRLLCQKCGDSLRKLLNDFGLAV